MVGQKGEIEATVKIRDTVLGSIARLAAVGTKGVADMRPRFHSRLLGALLGKRLDEGVRVKFKENEIKVIVSVLMEYGANIPQVASAVQENVMRAIEQMTGIASLDVIVDVRGVVGVRAGH